MEPSHRRMLDASEKVERIRLLKHPLSSVRAFLQTSLVPRAYLRDCLSNAVASGTCREAPRHNLPQVTHPCREAADGESHGLQAVE